MFFRFLNILLLLTNRFGQFLGPNCSIVMFQGATWHCLFKKKVVPLAAWLAYKKMKVSVGHCFRIFLCNQ